MTEYDPQLTEALEQDYHFLVFRLEELHAWLRYNPGREEDPISTEEFGLFWLVNRRAKEYGMTTPEPTIVNTYLMGYEVLRKTKRLYSKQMIAKIREDLNRKDSN